MNRAVSLFDCVSAFGISVHFVENLVHSVGAIGDDAVNTCLNHCADFLCLVNGPYVNLKTVLVGVFNELSSDAQLVRMCYVAVHFLHSLEGREKGESCLFIAGRIEKGCFALGVNLLDVFKYLLAEAGDEKNIAEIILFNKLKRFSDQRFTPCGIAFGL